MKPAEHLAAGYLQSPQGQFLSRSMTVTTTILFLLGATTTRNILSSLVLPSSGYVLPLSSSSIFLSFTFPVSKISREISKFHENDDLVT